MAEWETVGSPLKDWLGDGDEAAEDRYFRQSELAALGGSATAGELVFRVGCSVAPAPLMRESVPH